MNDIEIACPGNLDNPLSLNSDIYCFDNPILNIDINGKRPKPYDIEAWKKAYSETEARFNGETVDDEADAFKHAYRSELITKSVGPCIAKKYGDAHEAYTQGQWGTQMDLYNNAIGIDIALAYKDSTDQELADRVEGALMNGRLMVIHPKCQVIHIGSRLYV